MRLKDYAEKILFGKNLEDKLFRPEKFEDSDPLYTGRLPAKPFRPEKLLFSKNKSSISFPRAHELESTDKVASVMHYFANHELLALEIMALVLLKFPEAPKAFRMGVAKEMREEQEHMELYISRMNELGMEFGEIPVNDFFWRLLSDMDHPIDFCSKMGITFEQANLDFSKYFLNEFEKLGDHKSKDLLEKVYLDEISHVGFGLHWFKKWNENPNELFEAHKSSLKFPLGLQRAKAAGKFFDRDARKKAGFDEDYIDKLELFTSSKERPPILRVFNPELEEEVLSGKPSYTPKKITQNIKQSLEHFLWVVSKSQDVVVVGSEPSRFFLKQLKSYGIDYPEYCVVNSKQDFAKLLKSRKFECFEPWGQSPKYKKMQEENSDSFQYKLMSLETKDLLDWNSQITSSNLLREFVNKKPEYQDFLVVPEDLPMECSSLEDFESNLKGLNQFVIKAPLGLSGRGVFFFNTSEIGEARECAARILKSQSRFLVEKKFDRLYDFSLQMYPNKTTKEYTYQIARFFSSANASYGGGIVGRDLLIGMDSDFKAFWDNYGERPNKLQAMFDDLTSFLGEKLKAAGYFSALGVDCFAFRDESGKIRIKALVEINFRFNMGFLKTRMKPLVSSSSTGLYQVLSKKQFKDYYPGLSWEQIQSNSNPVLKNGMIEQGLVYVSDPYVDGDFLAVLYVGKTLDEIKESYPNMLS